ncbi:TonB-dependent receptor domain-containing protein [Robiginitalea aurantiaca]|uniref:TonB-dependent receptor n=1 Tax=Robiginitalea aurantiaca TaxID=3056915 RepID=A0ABT7WG35_9FLAO|nr:TonB-dependent receptor [Robiginitalea aurantiaca]MDM9631873.1 TonB-dependent receptor [Robiginitalea aurantiaca]
MTKILVPLLALFCLGLHAQRPTASQGRNITLTGTVMDKDTGTPLEFATVVVQNANDPSKITGGMTDLDGKFSVETPAGVYNIRVEYISYESYSIESKELRQSQDLGNIRISVSATQLEAVEVVGEKTTVEVRLDKKIYNIGKDITTSGGTVTDALNNVPSVAVDVEGNISLRGNDNVQILINGRPSAIAGFGSTDALQQLPADAIEKVEVITSPSARYDAEGTAGILNIILKREKTLGFNGSVNSFIGYPTTSGITSNINLRSDKFNIFNTTGIRYRYSPGNGFFDNTYSSGSFDRITEDREIDRKDRSFNTNIGMEYFINERSSITGSFFWRYSKDEDVTLNESERYVEDNIQSLTLRQQNETEDDNSYQVSFNYLNKFDDQGHVLTADVQYSIDKENQEAVIEELITFPSDDLLALENVMQADDQTEWLIQADYVRPMEDAQFEAGFRSNMEEQITDYRLDSLDQATGEFVINEALTNIFTYNENVHAVYTQYGDKFGKFSFLAGLRLEYTQLKGNVESEFDLEDLEEILGDDVDFNFDKEYLGLFPTINLIYELQENQNITLGYNRRINRPRGWFINPFPSRSSRTNVFQGNPDLDPAFSDAFDLGYLKRWNELTLTSSVYYQRETGSFQRVQEATGITTPDGIEIIRTIPINLSTNQRYGAEAGILYNPTRWLRINSSFNFFRFVTEGEFNDVDYGAENNSWFGRFSSKVTLPGKVDWQTNMFYRGPSNNAQTEFKGIFSMNMALSKDIMDGNGTILLNVQDLFNSRKRRSFTETEFFTSDSEFQWRVRSFRLSFVYRFNQPKKRNGRGGGENFEDEGDFGS